MSQQNRQLTISGEPSHGVPCVRRVVPRVHVRYDVQRVSASVHLATDTKVWNCKRSVQMRVANCPIQTLGFASDPQGQTPFKETRAGVSLVPGSLQHPPSYIMHFIAKLAACTIIRLVSGVNGIPTADVSRLPQHPSPIR